MFFDLNSINGLESKTLLFEEETKNETRKHLNNLNDRYQIGPEQFASQRNVIEKVQKTSVTTKRNEQDKGFGFLKTYN